MNGILWILRTRVPWQHMPDRYPSPATCHRRFQRVDRERRSRTSSASLGRGSATTRQTRSFRVLDRQHLRGGQERSSVWKRPSGVRVPKLMAMANRTGLPVAAYDSDPLVAALARQGIETIAPNREALRVSIPQLSWIRSTRLHTHSATKVCLWMASRQSNASGISVCSAHHEFFLGSPFGSECDLACHDSSPL